MTDHAAIRRCITDCAAARDWRGRWRQVNACAQSLYRADEPAGLSVAQAAAAGRIGAWLATVKLP
jgi:hypothetical protein